MFAVIAASAVVIGFYLAHMPAPLNSPEGQRAALVRAGRFLLTILLMLLVYRGQSVARWICIFLFGVSVIIGIPLAITTFGRALLVFHGTLAYSLLFSADVLEFLERQRSGRPLTDEPDEPLA
jgi:hypothetical protein